MIYKEKKKKRVCHLCGLKAVLGHAYCSTCEDLRSSKARERRRSRFGKCAECDKGFIKFRRRVFCNDCSKTTSDRFKTYQRGWRLTLKKQIFDKYGKSVCACCGESELRFLSIDHINNDGAAHRKTINPKNFRSGTGVKLYSWLRRNGFPPQFQVLCMNCNFGKKMNGGICPHKEH